MGWLYICWIIFFSFYYYVFVTDSLFVYFAFIVFSVVCVRFLYWWIDMGIIFCLDYINNNSNLIIIYNYDHSMDIHIYILIYTISLVFIRKITIFHLYLVLAIYRSIVIVSYFGSFTRTIKYLFTVISYCLSFSHIFRVISLPYIGLFS